MSALKTRNKGYKETVVFNFNALVKNDSDYNVRHLFTIQLQKPYHLTPTSPASALSRNLLVPNSRIQIANQFPGTKLAFTPKVYSFGELDTISHISNLFLAILNNPSTYEILNPEDFGLTRYVHFASRLTGWNAVKTRVAQLGLQMTDEQVKEW